MVITFIDGMFSDNILLEIKIASHLKGGIHGSVHVHKKILFSDFLLILSVKNPADITSVITYYN